MSSRPAQLNIRSDLAVARTRELMRRSGLSATRIVEEALLAYAPFEADTPIEGLERRGKLLVGVGGPPVTAEQVQGSIDETRGGVRD